MKEFYKSGKQLLVTLLLMFLSNEVTAQYCTTNLYGSSGCNWNNGNGDYIQSFSTTGGSTNITNNNTFCNNTSTGASAGYTYFSSQTHTAAQGSTVSFSFTNNPNFTQEFGIWVDWNQDLDFTDPGEQVYSSGATQIATNQTVTGSFTVPANASIGTTRLRIRCSDFVTSTLTACSQESFGEAEDYNFVVQANTCTGTPNPNVASTNSAFCGSSIFFLASNLTGSGYTFQWQSANPCTQNFTNITGATSSSYTISSLAAETAYRVIVTCTTSSGTFTSAPLGVYPIPACYCSSAPTSGAGADIGRVSFGGYSNPVATPAVLVNNAAAVGSYSSYLGFQSATLTAGNTYPLSVTQINSGPYTQAYLKVFIDYNKDGDFIDAGEEIFAANGPAGAQASTFSGNFTIPTTAIPGYSRIRFVLVQGGTNTAVSSCNSTTTGYNGGETEDYSLLILPAKPMAKVNAKDADTICVGNTLNFTATTTASCGAYAWTGPNGFSSSLQNPVINNATAAAAGNYVLAVSAYGVTLSDTVSVLLKPTSASSTAATICSGDTLLFGTTVITSAGVYLSTFTAANGCDSVVTLTVSLTPKPVISGVTPTNPTNCGGSNGSITISGLSNGTTYTVNYSKNSVAQTPLSLTASAGSITIPNLTAGSYSGITVTANGCTSLPAAMVQLTDPNAPAAPSASNNGPLCAGSTLNLFAGTVTGATYSWTGPNGFTSSAQNPTIINAQAIQTGTYSVSITVNNCTSGAATTSVIINPIPAAPLAGSNSPICAGSALNLNASTIAGATYSWTGPNGFTSSAQNPVVNPAGTNASGTYSVTASVNGCTSGAATTIVTVHPIPMAPTASSNSPLCEGSNLNLSATSIAGAIYSWTGPNGFTSSSQNPVLTAVTTSASGVYGVTATANGCTSAVDTTLVTVNAIPVIGAVNFTNPTTCGGTNGTISITGLSGNLTYLVNFSKNGNPQTPQTLVANTSGTATLTGLSAGTYSGITITLNGCISTAAGPVTLSDPAAPAAPAVSNNGPLCAGATLNLNASSVAGATYSWTGPNGFTSSLQNPVINNVPIANAGTYSVTVNTNNCPSAPATTTVVINPTPVIASTSFSNPTTCGGTNGTITLTGLQGNTTYSLSYTLNAIVSTTSATSSATGTITITGLGAGIYSTITVTVNGCTSVPAGPITLSSPLPPAAPVASSNGPVCSGNTLNLFASTVAGATYSWTGPNGFTSALQNPTIPNAQTTNAATYAVTATVNNCTSAVATVSVVVNPTPVITSTAFTNPTGCNGTNGTISLSGLTGNTTYTVSFSKNGIPQTVQTITSTATGVVVITGLNAATYSNIILTLAGCNSAGAGPITLTDPSSPSQPTVSNNGPICAGSTLSLFANTVTGATYSWTGPGGFSSSLQNPVINNATTANAGSYTLTITLNNCTSLPSATNVVINPIPATPSAGSNSSLCAGSNLNLTASSVPGATYSWTGPNSFTSSAQNPVITAAGTSATGSYSVTATLNGCTSLAGLVNVVVHPIPAISSLSSTNPTFCNGTNGSITLNGLAASSSYSVTYTANGISQSQTVVSNASGAVVLTGLGAGNYTNISVTLNGCVSNIVGPALLVDPVAPLAPVSNNVSYCQNVAAAPLAATGQNLLWYTTPTGGTGSSTAPVPGTFVPGTFTWYVSQTANNCESPRTPVNVTIIPQPSAPIVSSPVNYCQGQPAVPLVATGQNLLWFTSATGGSGVGTAPVPATAAAGTTTWYVSQTIGGCESVRSPVVVNVYPKPSLPTVTSPVSYCEGTDAMPLSAQGQNLLWYTTPTGGNGSSAAPVPNTSLPGDTVFYVSQVNNGCESDRAMINVVVNEKVFAKIFLSSTAICQFDTILVRNDTSNPSAAVYAWNFDGGSVLSGAGAGPYSIKWNADGTKTVMLTVTNGACSASASRTLFSRPSPDADFVIQEHGCVGDTVNVQAAWNSLAGATFNWSFDGASVLSGTGRGLYELRWNTAGSKTVSLQILNDNGCRSDLVRDTIMIHEKPVAEIVQVSKNNICAGDTVVFSATSQNASSLNYTWSPSEFFLLNGLPEVPGAVKRTGLVFVTVSDAFGCSNADSVAVTTRPCCELALPDAFTPNKDGRNDVFRVITEGNHRISVFKVVNRWGQVVFETGDQTTGWDGTFGGRPQDMGTYYYYIRYICDNNKTFEKKGEVILIR